MYEENRSTGWSGYLIKGIIVIIFILFTVWLLSLSNKGIHKKLDVITDTIFAENVDRMKQVGKDYFTTERLPKKIGEIKTISLEEMYNNNYIFEVKDKNGHACSARNSYVSVEKMENEYQMKIFLECGKVSNFIIVPMGCYNYCDDDICEKQETVGLLEYEYKKSTGGYWTNYGSWSEWSKVAVSNTNYREVETKTEIEKYSYEKTALKNDYKEFVLTCPTGYKKTNDGTKCYATSEKYEYVSALKCPSSTSDGFTLVSQNGFTCNYSKSYKPTANPLTCAKTYNDYNLVSQNGFTCTYSKSYKPTANPLTCAKTYNGYNLVNQNGFTCNYSKSYKPTTNPLTCAKTYNGYNLVSQNGFTCNYTKTISVPYTYSVTVGCTTCYSQQVTQSCSTCAPVVTTVPYTCGCHNETRTGYNSETKTTTTTVGCPSGYTKSGNSCVKTIAETKTTTTTVGCPSGYTKSGNSCVKTIAETKTTTTTVGCPSGYTKSGNSCLKTTAEIENKTTTVGCPAGYTKNGTKCQKQVDETKYSNFINSCPSGYKNTSDNTKCYKEVSSVVTVDEEREVTYYRYRVREFIGATTDYKWSTSNNDSGLLNAGYTLTGRTRGYTGK